MSMMSTYNKALSDICIQTVIQIPTWEIERENDHHYKCCPS